MLAKVTGIYRIHTKEIKYSQSGSPILSLNLVNSEKFKTQSGEQKENTCWIKATAFGKKAEMINTYFDEKDRIFISGKLGQDQWTDQQGNKKSMHKITIDDVDFIEKKDNSNNNNGYGGQQSQNNYGGGQQQNQSNSYGQPQQQQNAYEQPQTIPEIDIDDDEIPF